MSKNVILSVEGPLKGNGGRVAIIRYPMVEEEHAQLARPDCQNHCLFHNQHPFAAFHTLCCGLRSQGGLLFRSHEIRASAEEDFVEGDDEEGVPQDGVDGQPIIQLQLAATPRAYTCYPLHASTVNSSVPQVTVGLQPPDRNRLQSQQNHEHPNGVEGPCLHAELTTPGQHAEEFFFLVFSPTDGNT